MKTIIEICKRVFGRIKRPITSGFRMLRHPVRGIKRIGKAKLIKIVTGYLIAALGGTYLTTALFTPANFFKPAQVIAVAQHTGIVNILTGGTFAPIVSGFKDKFGDLFQVLGERGNIQSFTDIAADLHSSAADYFERGEGVFDDSVVDTANFFLGDIFKGFGKPGDSGNFDDSNIDVPAINNSESSTTSTNSADKLHELALQPWNASTAPNGYQVLDMKADIDYSIEAGNIHYTGFDKFGRTGRAVGNITYDMVKESSGWRAKFASDVDSKLSGWGKNKKITSNLPGGITYSGYMYNRSHLIADSLGGYKHVYKSDGSIDTDKSVSEAQNLVTGTRFQNVGTNNSKGSGYGGMAYFEDMARKYLTEHENCAIWYSVEPVYASDNEIIPRACIVKMVSCDSDGNHGINLVGIVYNVQPGYTVDYTTGNFTKE